MASDRGKQQAYCKVCSKHFSVSVLCDNYRDVSNNKTKKKEKKKYLFSVTGKKPTEPKL